MRIRPTQLADSNHRAYYLYGEDRDAMQLAANQLLQRGDSAIPRLRVDCNELTRIASEWGNPSLFGPSGCIGLLRNAESATPKQSKQLLQMVESVPQGSMLIICAGGAMWKKALHKKLQAIQSLACCEFTIPTPAQFKQWLRQAAEERGVPLDQETLEQAGERLVGMQQAAEQWLQRLQWYYGGKPEEPVRWRIAGILLGEQAPAELESWCHAVASKSPQALPLQRRLVDEQQVHPVQMLSWLGTRMQQIVLYRWHQSRQARDAAREAKLFGSARQQVPREAAVWSAEEITTLLPRISRAEQQLKGASIEADHIVLERLVRELIAT